MLNNMLEYDVKRNCFDLNFMQIIANKFFGFD